MPQWQAMAPETAPNPAAPSLLLDEDARRRLWRTLETFSEDFLRRVDTLPVAPHLDMPALRAFLAPFTFESPRAPDELVPQIANALVEHQVHVAHPCYYGLFNPAPSTMGIAGEVLTAVLNPQLAGWSHSPLAVEIERHVIHAMGGLIWSGDVDGTFTTAGAEANMTAVMCALARHAPQALEDGLRALPHSPVMYVSAEGHHSFVKAARNAGLGDRAVRHVPVRSDLTMDPQQLRALIAADRAAGLAPFLVVATAGTTGSGTIDPLGEVAAIAGAEGMWFHVDAAWGGAARIAPAWRAAFAGIERADSVTIDAHKWLSVPMTAGLFLTRDLDILSKTFAFDTSYMPREGREFNPVNPYAHSIQWSRRFAGLKLFLSLAAAGWDGYAATVSHMIEMGALLRERLVAAGWRIVNQTPLPVVCFTPADVAWTIDDHQSVAEDVIRSGSAWISTIVLGSGQPALRACITNYRTMSEHIDALVAAVETARRAHGT